MGKFFLISVTTILYVHELKHHCVEHGFMFLSYDLLQLIFHTKTLIHKVRKGFYGELGLQKLKKFLPHKKNKKQICVGLGVDGNKRQSGDDQTLIYCHHKQYAISWCLSQILFMEILQSMFFSMELPIKSSITFAFVFCFHLALSNIGCGCQNKLNGPLSGFVNKLPFKRTL